VRVARGQDNNQVVSHFISHDEGRDDEFSGASNAAPSSEARMQQQRRDTFVDACCHAIGRYGVLIANVGDNLIKLR
jgi:hypothetical protein